PWPYWPGNPSPPRFTRRGGENRPHGIMSLKAKAVSGAVSTGTGQLLKFVVRTVSLVVLARYLGPADYGLVALVTAITSVLRVFQDAGLSMATVQAPAVSQ